LGPTRVVPANSFISVYFLEGIEEGGVDVAVIFCVFCSTLGLEADYDEVKLGLVTGAVERGKKYGVDDGI